MGLQIQKEQGLPTGGINAGIEARASTAPAVDDGDRSSISSCPVNRKYLLGLLFVAGTAR
jgi:hypothetical protein